MSNLDKSTLSPEYDGITHINISYLATTELGKLLNDSSDLLVPFQPKYNNPDQRSYYFTAYSWFAFCMTTSGRGDSIEYNLELAGATPEFTREYLRNNKLHWNRRNLNEYIRGLRKRLDREDVQAMMRANTLPIVSYTMSNGKHRFRSNDRYLVKEYNKVDL